MHRLWETRGVTTVVTLLAVALALLTINHFVYHKGNELVSLACDKLHLAVAAHDRGDGPAAVEASGSVSSAAGALYIQEVMPWTQRDADSAEQAAAAVAAATYTPTADNHKGSWITDARVIPLTDDQQQAVLGGLAACKGY